MKNYVTRGEIVKAILTEPLLAAGAWATLVGDDTVNMSSFNPKTKDKRCRVCAIGSILRRHVKLNSLFDVTNAACSRVKYASYYALNSAGYARHRAEYLRNSNLYLSLLSCEFERRFGYAEIINSRGRKSFAEWVKKTFPSRVSLVSEKV